MSNSAGRASRIMSLILALVFLIGTVGFSVAVLFQNKNNKNKTEQPPEQTQLSSAGKPLEGFAPVSKVEKLQIIDQKTGEGSEAKATSQVTVHYTGALATTGIIFESSLDIGQPITFPLDKVIKGWIEGVPGMKVGGKRRLIIPAELAYGKAGSPPSIPPNTPLVFDIELLAVK